MEKLEGNALEDQIRRYSEMMMNRYGAANSSAAAVAGTATRDENERNAGRGLPQYEPQRISEPGSQPMERSQQPATAAQQQPAVETGRDLGGFAEQVTPDGGNAPTPSFVDKSIPPPIRRRETEQPDSEQEPPPVAGTDNTQPVSEEEVSKERPSVAGQTAAANEAEEMDFSEPVIKVDEGGTMPIFVDKSIPPPVRRPMRERAAETAPSAIPTMPAAPAAPVTAGALTESEQPAQRPDSGTTPEEEFYVFAEQNPQRGVLQVQTLTARRTFPVPNTEIVVSKVFDSGEHFIVRMLTDNSGQTERVLLPAPDRSYSESPGNGVKPYADYRVTVRHPEFVTIISDSVPIFSGERSLQILDMIPLAASPGGDAIKYITTEPSDL